MMAHQRHLILLTTCLVALGPWAAKPALGQDPSRDAAMEQVEEFMGDMIGEQGGKPAGPPPEVEVTADGRVEFHAADLDLSEALQLLSQGSRRNIVASPAVSGSVTASLYGVTFEEALNAILLQNGAGFIISGNFIYVYTNDELDELDLAANPPETRVFPLNYINATDAQTYITPVLSSIGSAVAPPAAGSGVASAADEAGGDSAANQEFIIVTDRPEHLERVGKLLKEIDVRPLQVLVEATILRAQLTEDNAMGIDFSIVGGVDLELLSATSNAITDLTLGPLPRARLERFNANMTTTFIGNVPPGGASIGIIKDHVAVFLRALESVTDITVLANPKLLALNRQRAQVIVGRRDGFLTTTVTETQAIQSVEFLETGTQLIFRPFISRDGYIRVELHPEDSVGFVNAQGLPSEQTTEVTTNVIIRDGHTILIAGLFRDVTTDARSQVPGLGSLPIIGPLFRSNNDKIAREEVIILLTIHIVKDYDAFEDESARQLQEIEGMRVGLRQGMMWHGRERLAQTHYQKAVECFATGRNTLARWNVNLALHNRPRFMAARQLKEKLTGSRSWDDDGTSARAFLQTLMARESGVVLPIFGRPAPPFAGPDELHGPSGFEESDGS